MGSQNHKTAYYATDKSSLQSALAAATPEDTVYLTEGTYAVSASVVPQCSMMLSGGWNASFTQQTGLSHIKASGLTEAVINIPHYYNLTLDHIELSEATTPRLTVAVPSIPTDQTCNSLSALCTTIQLPHPEVLSCTKANN